MQNREELLGNIQKAGGYSPMFSIDYVQKLAVACIHRLDKEAHEWMGETNRAYKSLKTANERIKTLQS